MTVKRLDLPPPKRWEDFEDLCLGLWRELLEDPGIQKHGRAGQPQAGVDIFGRSADRRRWVGISCKALAGKARLVPANLWAEVEKAKTFEPPLSEFVVATTASRDVEIQKLAREITQSQLDQGSFAVVVYSWDDIVDALYAYPDLLVTQYPTLKGLLPETEQGQGFQSEAWRLEGITLTNVGPAREFQLDLHPRLNILAGDNGLGKTLALEILWWLLTDTWAGQPAFPGKGQSLSRIGCSVTSEQGDSETLHSDWDYHKLSWTNLRRREPGAGLVIYLRAEGGISVWDPARFGLAQEDSLDGREKRTAATHLSRKELWEGKQDGEAVVSNGLLRDWVSWQHQRHPLFDSLSQAIAALSPHYREAIRPGTPVRASSRDVRDVPTIELPYGTIPVTHISAGMRRVLSLAYALVWAWHEHQELSRLRNTVPTSRMVLLIDELEAHLHPRWQRALLPALFAMLSQLRTELEVQTIGSTHAPLVLASIEPSFDPELDSVSILELADGGLQARLLPWAQQGDAVGWLTSDVFGLRQARSQEAERAIEAAEAYMRGDSQSLPPGLQTEAAIHAELCRVVPGHDPFWPRWIVTARNVI